MNAEELKQQEAVRERVYDPLMRWKHIQERIEWAEKHIVHRSTPAACIAAQERQSSRQEKSAKP